MKDCYDEGKEVDVLRGPSPRFALVVSLIFVALSFYPALSAYPVLSANVGSQYETRLAQVAERLRTEGFSDEEINTTFSDSRLELYPEIVGRSGKGLDYMGRKFGMLTKRSLERGQRVLSENREVLEEVEQLFGVEKEVIVAILRIETDFGRKTGKYPVFNCLLTMAIVENRRSSWAENELIEFLRLCREQNKDPFAMKGSWAGAFGICQFIPSSYARFAVDGNGDGVIDLFDFGDAVASIANYLKAHGWESGNPGAMRQAIHAYNRCDSYVEAVLAYAKATKEGS